MSDFRLYTEQFGLLHFDCKSYPPLSFFFFLFLYSFIWSAGRSEGAYPPPPPTSYLHQLNSDSYCLWMPLVGWNFSNPSSSDLGFLVVCRQHKLRSLIAKRTRVTDQPLPTCHRARKDGCSVTLDSADGTKARKLENRWKVWSSSLGNRARRTAKCHTSLGQKASLYPRQKLPRLRRMVLPGLREYWVGFTAGGWTLGLSSPGPMS